MDERGFFSTPRDIEDDPIFDNPKLFKVYLWCRLKAGHQDERFVMVGNQIVRLTKNQFIFGTFTAEKKLKMKHSTIWRYLRILEKRQKLGIKTTNKYSIITVRCDILNRPKWESNGKQMGTTNNVDNDKQQDTSLREEEKDIREDIERELKKKESLLKLAEDNNQSKFKIGLLSDNVNQLRKMLDEYQKEKDSSPRPIPQVKNQKGYPESASVKAE